MSSAAIILAVTGAQAADLPVKAKAVEYVKICSLYGAGYYYIPGTDTCIKIGGYVRVQTETNAGAGGIVTGSQQMAPQGRFTRDLTTTSTIGFARAVSFDTRTQTDYGTLRSYIRPDGTTRRRPTPVAVRPRILSGTAPSSSSPASRLAGRYRFSTCSPMAALTPT